MVGLQQTVEVQHNLPYLFLFCELRKSDETFCDLDLILFLLKLNFFSTSLTPV